MKSRFRTLVVIIGSLAAIQVFAQGKSPVETYPSKSIRLVVPTAPGGGVDTLVRIVGQALTTVWGQQVIVDNRAGASGNRSPFLPDVPTMAEAGVPGFEVANWIGVMAPSGTWREIVQKLNAVLVKILATPATMERFKISGVTPDSSTPEEFGRFLNSEIERWGDVIRAAKIRVN